MRTGDFMGGTGMILAYMAFNRLNELVDYVNKEEIVKLDIQEIRETDDMWVLLYWRVRE